MSKKPETMVLLFSDASGIYIPQRFANEMVRERVTGVSAEDYTILEAGPNHDLYWDAWSDVLDNARILVGGQFKPGTVYTLYQDGDCWAIRDGAQFNESGDGDIFTMPEDDQS